MRSDRDVVSLAIEQDGSSLEYASHDLRGDKDLVIKTFDSLKNISFLFPGVFQ